MKAYPFLVDDVRRAFGWQLFAVIPLMALVGATEGLSITLLFPLLTRIGIASGGEKGPVIAAIEALLDWLNASDRVATVLLAIILVSIVQMVLFLSLSWWLARLAAPTPRTGKSGCSLRSLMPNGSS